MTSRNPSITAVALPIAAFAVVLLAWHWAAVILIAAALGVCWRGGRRSGRRSVARWAGRRS